MQGICLPWLVHDCLLASEARLNRFLPLLFARVVYGVVCWQVKALSKYHWIGFGMNRFTFLVQLFSLHKSCNTACIKTIP